jgi:type VI secretion system protein ImpE
LEVDVKAKELLEANQLSAAVAELTQEVKRHPSDPSLRTFLFEVLCFSGEFERAERQLDVIGHQNEKSGIGVEIYRNLIRAENARQKLFSQGLTPKFLVDPPDYVMDQLEAIHCLRGGNAAEAKALLGRSQGGLPTITCRINGKEFSGFWDSDDRTASILEVFAHDVYVWVPLGHIVKVTITAPKHLRDLLWLPATMEVVDRTPVDVFLPVLYAGSEHDENDQIRLGRMTDWLGLGEGIAGGRGQKVFLAGDEEKALLEIRELEFEVSHEPVAS